MPEQKLSWQRFSSPLEAPKNRNTLQHSPLNVTDTEANEEVLQNNFVIFFSLLNSYFHLLYVRLRWRPLSPDRQMERSV
ncbi:hypothetical protein R3I94_021565 [Phoxinus phoxinus]